MDFLDRTLENFREYLKENTDSKNTVKNYVSDLRIFLIFLDSRHSPITDQNFPLFLNNQTLEDFSNYLKVINPPATLNRRVSSVKKFFDYYLEHHPLPITQPPTVSFTPTPVTASEPDNIYIPTPAVKEEDVIISEDIVTNEEPNNLLRLLPEEISTTENSQSVGHRPSPTPSNFLKNYSTQIICVVSFLVGFFATMAVYPLLYP